MTSASVIFAAIALIIVILIGGAVALLYLYPNFAHRILTTPSLSTTSTASTSNSTSRYTSSNSTGSSICTSSCVLKLTKPGSNPLLSSPLTTPMPSTNFQGDGPCCSQPNDFSNEINYTDHGNLWILQGDLEPMGRAWALSNSSGLTLNYQTCPTSGNLSNCGPHAEFHAGEAFDDSGIYADLGALPILPSGSKDTPSFGPNRYLSSTSSPLTLVPANATVFSIVVNLERQDFSGCTNDTGSGCTFEDIAYDSAALGFDVGGNYDVVSIAELCGNGIPCSSPALQMSAYTSNGGASVVQVLKTITNPTFTPQHRLTIATDRRTFISFYVDNELIYSNSTIPIEQNPSASGALEISMHTSVNNQTEEATFSNATVYGSSTVTATGLSSGMALVVNGLNGFTATGAANSSGIATVNVSPELTNLTVSVNLNGNLIANYSSPVSAGAEFSLSS